MTAVNQTKCRSNVRKTASQQLRWDKADLSGYYYSTGEQLALLVPLLDDLLRRCSNGNNIYSDLHMSIDGLYCDIVNKLSACAKTYVPTSHKNFYKFWWDEELTILKEASVESNKIWKAAGSPRHGPIFEKGNLVVYSTVGAFGKVRD